MAEYEGLKWKIIEKFKPEGDMVAEDRPYTKEEIAKMLILLFRKEIEALSFFLPHLE